MKKKKTKKKASNITRDILNEYMQAVEWSLYNLGKPPTKAQLAKREKERKAEEAKEKRRRAKKITMTIGEFEDKLDEARDNCY